MTSVTTEQPRRATAAGIELDNVSKVFPGGTRAVDNIAMDISEGEFMVLVGPSGCGKSTLLRMIAGLEETSGGRISIGGRDVTRVPPRDRDIAMVFQNYALYPHMTVRENLGYALKVRRADKAAAEVRVNETAELLGLDELMNRKPSQLSGGQRQRVAMGRAIVREPKAFLMDEPLSNLDAKLRVSMRSSLAELHERLDTTTVYVTHDQVEAMTLGQRVAVMRSGKVQQVDTPQRLYRDPANLFVASFIGSPAMNLVEAELDGDSVSFGSHRIPLDSQRRPAAKATGRLVVGIRPEDFEDAAYGEQGEPQIDITTAVVEELGSDAHIIFRVDAPPLAVEDVKAATDEEDTALMASERATFRARVDPRTAARAGETLRLSVDPSQLYFFDSATGESLLRA
jgi:multiple sugar transport system ATP-binding protein